MPIFLSRQLLILETFQESDWAGLGLLLYRVLFQRHCRDQNHGVKKRLNLRYFLVLLNLTIFRHIKYNECCDYNASKYVSAITEVENLCWSWNINTPLIDNIDVAQKYWERTKIIQVLDQIHQSLRAQNNTVNF